MFGKFFNYVFISSAFFLFTGELFAQTKYEIQDVGTLQARSSGVIDINNLGQVLGWYNVDGKEKEFFLKDSDHSLHVIPRYQGAKVEWKFLNNHGRVFGMLGGEICQWDQKSGSVLKRGPLPGEIMGVNDSDQVLLKSVTDSRGGKTIYVPAIWQNGNLKKLRGLEGSAGVEAENSSGFAINNKGEVVGQSNVIHMHKNNLYVIPCATKWAGEVPEAIYKKIPKAESSSAIGINNNGDVLICRDDNSHKYVLSRNGSCEELSHNINNINNLCAYDNSILLNLLNKKAIATKYQINIDVGYDHDSIWSKIIEIKKVNDKLEMIASARTIYGEEHCAFLIPLEDEGIEEKGGKSSS